MAQCRSGPSQAHREWVVVGGGLRDFPGCPVVKTLPSNAGRVDSISGQEAKIPHSLGPKHKKKKQKQYCDKFNKDFKSGPHQKILKIVGLDKLSRFY